MFTLYLNVKCNTHLYAVVFKGFLQKLHPLLNLIKSLLDLLETHSPALGADPLALFVETAFLLFHRSLAFGATESHRAESVSQFKEVAQQEFNAPYQGRHP